MDKERKSRTEHYSVILKRFTLHYSFGGLRTAWRNCLNFYFYPLIADASITWVIVQNTILGREERVEGKIGRKGESKKDRSSEECECT